MDTEKGEWANGGKTINEGKRRWRVRERERGGGVVKQQRKQKDGRLECCVASEEEAPPIDQING